jgi:UDP-N-acetyl-D-glucosamine dehydrogenase
MHTVAVIGLGYVGLPLSLRFAEIGVHVIGLDVDETKIKTLQAGETYIRHLGTDRIKATAKEGTFVPSSDMSRVSEAEAVILCVPTPLTKQREPDLSYVLKTGGAIAPPLQRGTLAVLESTTNPGTTDEDLRAVLEEGSGMNTGADFHLAYSPEREDPGNANSKVGKCGRSLAVSRRPAARKPWRFTRARWQRLSRFHPAKRPRRRSFSKTFSEA